MVTKGIVEEIINIYQAKVRLPVYDGFADTKNATPSNELTIASICNIPNIYNTIAVGDIVYVAFEDNDLGNPVILGQLYKEEMHTLADIKLNSANINQLTVNKNASLPQNTSIGSISSKEIAALSGVKDNIQNQIDNSIIYSQSIISNPNLLINGDFKVNQRGKTSYTHTGKQYGYTYFVDRWFAWGENPFTFDVSTKTLTPNTSNTGNSLLSQWIEDVSGILGKTITYSVSTNGTIYSKTLNIPTTLSNNVSLGELPTSFGKLRVWSNNNRLRFDIIDSSNQSIVLNYAKVEIGSMATAFSPIPYAEELAMCQRYYQNINTISSLLYARTTDQLRAMINFKAEMRTKPTLTQLNTIRVFGPIEGTTFSQTSASIGGATSINKEGIMVALLGFSGLTKNNIYQLDLGVSAEPMFTVDAEIY